MNPKFQKFKYILFDYLSSISVWVLFFIYRKVYIENLPLQNELLINNNRFWLGVIAIPLFWVCLYAVNGMYKNPYRKSRLKELTQTLWICLFGVTVIFFSLLLDDTLDSYKSYYKTYIFLLISQFSFNYIFKLFLTTSSAHKVHNRQYGFNTLLIGSNEKAEQLYLELEKSKKSAGYKFVGFVNLFNKNKDLTMSKYLPHLGDISNIKNAIIEKQVEEVIIAIEPKEHEEISKIIGQLPEYNIAIKIIPDMYNILTGQVKMNSILHAALIDISFGSMPEWQKFIKRSFDITTSLLCLIFGAPVYLIISLLVKQSSKGPVFFKQERVGLYGKKFNIYKFRSMYIDAENNGPALSKEEDPRITPFGKFLRKTRLDEIPQFYNVLKGDMSIVGPRPERQFFIDQIIQKAPEYNYLNRIKPGITSWGQVKYGYAENVDEMIQRLKFDLIYLENMSLLVDLKILIHTILVVFQGKGK